MDQLTSVQLSEWEAYDRLDPIGKWRDEFGWATVVAQMTNLLTWAHAKKGTKNSAIDFMPKWDLTAPEETEVQTIEQMKAVFRDIEKRAKQSKAGTQPTKPPKKTKK